MVTLDTRLAIKHLHKLFAAETTCIDLSVPVSRGDLWDNRCTLHPATPFDRTRYKRELYRTTIAGKAPGSAFAAMPEPHADY